MGNENVVDAVITGHIHTIRADPGGVDAGPGVGENTVEQLIGSFGIRQVVIAQGDQVGLALRALQEPRLSA
jgi:3,4-dihydroxy-2-butanone 4-phosphate synthase